MAGVRKFRFERRVGRAVVNPLVAKLDRMGIQSSLVVELETTGAKSGQQRRVPLTGSADGTGSALGDESKTGQRARQRALRIQHRLEPRLVRDGSTQTLRHEQRRERRQCAKKTVARSPCMCTSNRSDPSSSEATSDDRESAGSEAKTGSSPFA